MALDGIKDIFLQLNHLYTYTALLACLTFSLVHEYVKHYTKLQVL